MTDTERGFYIVGQPELSPFEELELLIDELEQCPEKLKELREQEKQICDPKIYIKSDDHFEEVVLLKRAVKTAHVLLPCGTKQCLPGKYLDENGKYTRHMKTMDREFFCGWRARDYLLSRIESTEKRYARLRNKVIPDLVRSIRKSGDTIPREIVQSLVTHYRSLK
jgi:hypothetical protein